ncbi:MAG: hypothetical protein Ct9H90mP27_2500 [Gammaproteobacteria bacterium]|nr:MAG: hypothetical protein Ct9H90mP27_2500 [Gammaproteobacteria bacterium]
MWIWDIRNCGELFRSKSVCVDYDQQAQIATEQNAAFNELTKNELPVMHSSKLGLEETTFF